MGNLYNAYVTFGKRPEAIKKLLKTQDDEIPVFVELCKNGQWNATDIIEAATMSFDPLEQGVFAGIASSIAQAFSGARYRRRFTILEHPDVGRILATHAKTAAIFRDFQPNGPIELRVVIQWEFRSNNPEERVNKVVEDGDLLSKVAQAANFSGIIEILATEIETEYNRNGGGGLQDKIQQVLERETAQSITNAQEEFYRVLGLTQAKVVWQDTVTIGSAIWSAVSATVTTVGIVGSIAAGGPVGLAASLIYYCTNGMQALKGFVDTYQNLKNSFGDIATNLNSCRSDIESLKAQWELSREHANVVEASRRIIQAVFPESVIASTSSMSSKLEQIGTACDRMELTSRQLSPQLNESLQNLSAAQSVLEELEDILSDVDSSIVDAFLQDLRTNFSTLTSTFEQTFDKMADINREVLDHRQNMRNLQATLKAFQDKEMVWFRLWTIAWEHYVEFVGDLSGELAPDPTTETWEKINEVCETIDTFQKVVEKTMTIRENLVELYETVREDEEEG